MVFCFIVSVMPLRITVTTRYRKLETRQSRGERYEEVRRVWYGQIQEISCQWCFPVEQYQRYQHLNGLLLDFSNCF